jgi:uncharacterized membrane protein YccC
MLLRAAGLETVKQAIKTAIAGVISLAVTNLFHLPQGYWAAISALIVMQSNVGATLTASRTRLAGTAVGAVVGGLSVAIWHMKMPGANMLGFALAVAIAFYVCGLLSLADSQRLATVTVAIIMLAGLTSSAWVIALHRFAEVALGILIALLVSLTLWPNHARRSVRQGLAATLTKLRMLYQALVQSYRGESADSIETLKAQVSEALRTNAVLLQNALQEAFGPMKERESLALLANHVERIFHCIETLEFAVRDSEADTYFRNFEGGREHLEAVISQALDSLAKSIREGKLAPEWPDLPAAVSSLDAQAGRAREAGATQNYPLDEILRFYSLLISSRNLALELELARSLITSRFVGE